jgi:DnaK suppressor protein
MADPTNDLTTPPAPHGLIPDPNASPTEQILGTARQPDTRREQLDPKWQRFYDLLIEQRNGFIDGQTDLQSKAREVAPDPIQREAADVATEENQRDQLLGVVSMEQETLNEIEEALSRLENGTYGVCQATGKPIPEERLEAVPWTRFSVEGQEELERRGENIKASIGPLGRIEERGTAPAGPWRDHEGST